MAERICRESGGKAQLKSWEFSIESQDFSLYSLPQTISYTCRKRWSPQKARKAVLSERLPHHLLIDLHKQDHRDMAIIFFEADESCAHIRDIGTSNGHPVNTVEGESQVLKLSQIFCFFLTRKSILKCCPSFGASQLNFICLQSFQKSKSKVFLPLPELNLQFNSGRRHLLVACLAGRWFLRRWGLDFNLHHQTLA